MGNKIVLDHNTFECPENYDKDRFSKIILLFNKIDQNSDGYIDMDDFKIFFNYFKKQKGIKLVKKIQQLKKNHEIKLKDMLDQHSINIEKEKYQQKLNKIEEYSRKLLHDKKFIYKELLKEFKTNEPYYTLKDILLHNNQARVLTGTDKPYIIIHVNNMLCKLLGYKKKDLIGNTLKMIQGEKTCKKTLQKMHSVIQNKKTATFVLINYKKNKNTFINQLTIMPVLSKESHLCYYLGILKEISEEQLNNNDIIKDKPIEGVIGTYYIDFWGFFNYIKNKNLDEFENLISDFF